MGDEKKEKEENKKKEYETIKIKRSGLEKTRDVFSIIRDLLIILILIALLLAIVFLIQFLANIQTALQGGGLLGLLGGQGGGSGGLGSLFGGNPSGDSAGLENLLGSLVGGQLPTSLPKVQGDAETCSTLSGLQNKFISGDLQGAQSDLDKLEKTFKKNNWQDQLNTLNQIESDLSSGNTPNIFISGISLLDSIEC